MLLGANFSKRFATFISFSDTISAQETSSAFVIYPYVCIQISLDDYQVSLLYLVHDFLTHGVRMLQIPILIPVLVVIRIDGALVSRRVSPALVMLRKLFLDKVICGIVAAYNYRLVAGGRACVYL